MQFAQGMATLALILSLFAVSAASKDVRVIENTYWSKAEGSFEGNQFQLLLGLSGGVSKLVVAGETKTQYFEYNSEGCARFDDPSFCTACTAAGEKNGALMALVFAVLGKIGTLTTDNLRQDEEHDINCQKAFAIILSGMLGFLGSIAALSSFQQGCIVHIPTGWSAQPGPGFICLVIATLTAPVDAMLHALIATPPTVHGWSKASKANKLVLVEVHIHRPYIEGRGAYT
jgi:hypothetical protein